jgi:hypothetical protein
MNCPLAEENTVDNVEPILAGTLCLMSVSDRRQCPAVTRKIIDNLTLLSRHPSISPSFQRICEKLRDDWCERDLAQENGEEKKPFVYLPAKGRQLH